ncbi:pyridoxal 5'-phosphate synthase glutaminase subunit PdxT [Lysinibacillus telephonicus]|uniref:Pyridoxal 5'-phosphate synthase subunit PdxT n=1 Tax=Lysinibacillus telephonicus TaxID=1714840 RepID=A0A3S0QSL1_9BACI|nr:pyridoxal 5'-phosphate synthase glutaminase subunit PdxT [Lysinibacillus telephonicus]RTQ90577.1 pyridoxal 5'-phosphate synthase glutaminase subunit PdxT [Lysinibacillus telephonicus]
MLKIGVLALQGSVREHIQQIQKVGCVAVAVKSTEDLKGLNGLILPGGESTAIRKLLDQNNLLEPIRTLAKEGMPVFGTCAGLILLAGKVVGCESPHLGLMDVVVERNSYGRQVDSFEVELSIKNIGRNIPAVFIRAPHIVSVGQNVEILATFDNRIVLARDRHFLGCSFHPELTEDVRIIKYFVDMIQQFNHTSLAKLDGI